MSLKTNWEDTLSEVTSLKPDVEFIVNLEDGESLLTAHKYLLAFASPVFKEQFYGKNGRIEAKEGNTRVRIKLDASACASEAFLAFIYQKPVGNLSFKDMLQLLKLCNRYQVDQLGDYAKECLDNLNRICIDNLKHEMEDLETMRELHWIEFLASIEGKAPPLKQTNIGEDVHVMSIEYQDDIQRLIWKEDEEIVMCQWDEKMKHEDDEWETMHEFLWIDEYTQDEIQHQLWIEDEEIVRCQDKEKMEDEDRETLREVLWTGKMLSIEDQYDIQRQIWKEDKEMARCQYDEKIEYEDEGLEVMQGWLEEEEATMRREDAAEKRRQEKRNARFRRHEELFEKRRQEKIKASFKHHEEHVFEKRRPEKRKARFKPHEEGVKKSKMNNQCTNVSTICRNDKKKTCSFNLCVICCKKQDKVCRGHPRK